MSRKHLVEARKTAGKTAIAVGDEIGWSEGMVYAWERGRSTPDPATAARHAAAINLPPAVAYPEIFGQPAATTPEVRT